MKVLASYILPSPSTSITVQDNTKTVKFGNGYQQDFPLGVNYQYDEVELSYEDISKEQRNTLMSVLRAVSTWDRFIWKHPTIDQNVLTYSNDLSKAVWQKTPTNLAISSTSQPNAIGGNSANTFTFTSGTPITLQQVFVVEGEADWTASVGIKAPTVSDARLSLEWRSGVTVLKTMSVRFNPQTDEIIEVLGADKQTTSISVENSFKIHSIAGLGGSPTGNNVNYKLEILTGTTGTITIDNPQLNLGLVLGDRCETGSKPQYKMYKRVKESGLSQSTSGTLFSIKCKLQQVF